MTTTRYDDKATIAQYVKATIVPPRHRIPDSRDDYGDLETVGLSMKRDNVDFNSTDHDNLFGRYLGHHADGYAILVVTLLTGEPTAVEVFPTLEAMKQEWVLD